MSWLRFLKRAHTDRERRDELEAYQLQEFDDNLARGMSPSDARAAARRKLGNPTLIREEIYRMNTIALFDTLARDARHGLRLLARNPTFTVVSLLTLAIGIGANVAVFSVVNSVLLKPLAYPNSDGLVSVVQSAPGAAGLASVSGDLLLSPSMYFTYADHNRTLEAFGIWTPINASVTGIGDPEQVRAALLSDGVLQALGVPPAIGRSLGPGDQSVDSPLTLMLGYAYWQRRFGGDPSVIGRNLTVGGRSMQIAGVMPAGFRFLNTDADLILPARFNRANLILAGFGYRGIARLKPGVTIEQANADLARLLPVWMASWSNGPGTNPKSYEVWRITPNLRPLKAEAIGNIASALWILMATIGVVLLIACANVANLLLVRAETRRQELAVRAALGAGWARIVHELLLESMLLGLIGGAIGVGVASAGLRLLLAIGPANLPRLNEISLDARALAFALAVSLVSGLLFGLIPAFKYAGSTVAHALRGGGRNASQSRERHRARNALVIAQVALALLLLVCSGLMIRTFQALRTVQPGFTHADRIETMRIAIPATLVPDPAQVARIQNQILDKLAAIPGVASAAFIDLMPLEGPTDWDAILARDKPAPTEIPPMRVFKSVSPGLFQTIGTRFVAGRDFTWTDLYSQRPVVILSENLARELWGGAAAAMGKQVSTGMGSWREVVGVVEDVRQNGVDQPAPAAVYWPSLTEDRYRKSQVAVARVLTFAIRSDRAGTESFPNQIRQAVWSVNANLPVASMRTFGEIYQQSLARVSFTLVMLAMAGAMALALGVIGLYGLISYAVSQRRREIGIRLALGAQPAEVRRMFLGYALSLTGAGAILGLAASLGLTRLMKSLLFGISPLDPVTFAAVPCVLILAAMLAAYLPARRAAALDPVEALRTE